MRKGKDGGYGPPHGPSRAVKLSNSVERSGPGGRGGVACTVCGARTQKMGKWRSGGGNDWAGKRVGRRGSALDWGLLGSAAPPDPALSIPAISNGR